MNNLRRFFLLDPSITFLNHGSFGATPRPVFRAYQEWQRRLELQPVEFLGRRFTDMMQNSRIILGKYLNTSPDNLVYTTNVTVALNTVVRSLDLGPGDEVLSTDHEYGAIDRTWRFTVKEGGFAYVNQPIQVPLKQNDDLVQDYLSGVTPRTRVIHISHITSPTALCFPIKEIISKARSSGILTIVDGAHAPGQIQLDLDDLGADFYAGNLHKWLCAPKGAGFLFARHEMQGLLKPLIVSWGYEAETPGVSPFIDQHEWQGTRDVAAFLSVPEAIQFQEDHDWQKVRSACHELLREAVERISALTGLPGLSDAPRYAQMASLPLPSDIDLAVLKLRLYEDHRIEIPVLSWNGYKLIRVSIQGYNTGRDVDHLVKVLPDLLSDRGLRSGR
jgi:isopenicillin-N epimerase